MKRFALIVALPLMLFGCASPPDTIAGRIQDGIVKACSFKADYTWLTDVVTKADVTAQMIDGMIIHICAQITAARSEGSTQSLVDNWCQYGSIEVDGKTVCIEGKPVEGE